MKALRSVLTWLAVLMLPGLSVAQANRAGQADGFHGNNKREGWFWYEVRPEPKKPAPEAPVKPAAAVLAPAAPLASQATPVAMQRDLARFKDFKQQLEDALNASVINPSDANVMRYLQLWQESKRMASVFTDTAQAMTWRNPSLNDDFQGVRPASPAAMAVFDQQKESEQLDLVKRLAKTHGMFFFFRSDCPYCHALAPMLKQLSELSGLTIFPISMDGGGLPDFPRAKRDNGIASKMIEVLGIPPQEFQVPFTVLAQPGTREVLPVGFGVMTASEMLERISTVVGLRAQQSAEDAKAPGGIRSTGMGPMAASSITGRNALRTGQ